VLEKDEMGDCWDRSSSESSSSSFSGMLGSMLRPLHEGAPPGYGSSIAERKGLRLLAVGNGDMGLRAEP